MNSLKDGLGLLLVVLLLGTAVVGLWYLFVYLPARFSEPSGTLVQVPETVYSILEAEGGHGAGPGKPWVL